MQASLTSARLVDGLRGAAEVEHRVLLVSPPKAGTHLLGKALKLMPGIRPTYLHIERPILNRYADVAVDPGEWAIRFPQDEPAMRRLLARVGPGRFCTAHLGYHETIGTILDELDYKVLLILRDPRDIAVSLVNYLRNATLPSPSRVFPRPAVRPGAGSRDRGAGPQRRRPRAAQFVRPPGNLRRLDEPAAMLHAEV
jgi:hypothetical protein